MAERRNTSGKNNRTSEQVRPATHPDVATEPQPVVAEQSLPQGKSRASGTGDAKKQQKTSEGAKPHTLEDAAKPQHEGLFRAVIALYGVLIVLYAGWQVFAGARAVPDTEGLASNASLESNYAFFSATYAGLGLSFLFIAVKFRWVNMLVISCLVVFLGGVGRILAWASHGTPHWSLIVLMVTELVIPPCLLVWYAWINKSNKIRQEMLAASRTGKARQ